MTVPVTTVGFAPATPRAQIDGIVLTATGPVRPTGKIVITADADENEVVAASPEFGMSNRVGETNEGVSIAVTGAPAGGTLTLTAVAEGVEPSETEDDTGHGPLGTTAVIARNATAAAVEAAAIAAWGAGVAAAGGPLGSAPVTLAFSGRLGGRKVTVTAAHTFTGGTAPAVTVTETTAGGDEPFLLPGGPYQWGPINLFAGSYHVDVVTASGVSPGTSLLSATVPLVVT